MQFAKRGFPVHCVELGKNLADLLIEKSAKAKYNVKVDVSSFEDWKPPEYFECSFIFSATAFHWLDIDIKYKKCHNLLRDNGYLVLLWNDAHDWYNPILQEAYRRLFSYYPDKLNNSNSNTVKTEKNESRRNEIIESGYFEIVDFLNYKWFPNEKKDIFTKAFFTQSSFLSLEKSQQHKLSAEIYDLFKELDDEIKTEVHTSVFITKKLGRDNFL